MRRPKLSRWLKREVMRLADLDSFNMRKAAAAAQSEYPRAQAPLLLYAIAEGQTDKLMSLVWRDDVRTSYEKALTVIGDKNLEAAATTGDSIEGLDRDYAKHLESFFADYQKPETVAESKRLRLDRSRMLQLQKGISTAQICKDLGLNKGNVNDYLKNGNTAKLSLENADSVMKYLMHTLV